MRTLHVTGGGGTQLSVVETGNPQGHSIVFIHGFSQCGLCWSRQLDSDLAESCVAGDLLPQERYVMLGWNVNVPPYVRQALLSRAFDNDDLLGTIRKPVLITHGASDSVVKVAAAEHFKAAIPHAQLHLMPNVGHAPFWQDAASFNQRLEEFAAEAWKAASLQAAL